ncbi:Tat pathway signal protein [Sphingomonas sp. BT553]|uniref:Tat pathway signal protein n=2 Tax=Sphingomonas mollis TaxID=2795726 RepID=A0ABS0XQA2_9SPHN|nr:glucoamylase family protein [Sphingomonas sp. BT553]MBJ6122209.1 Tat pathway signal protein [Sphingomonas sp. BT553]
MMLTGCVTTRRATGHSPDLLTDIQERAFRFFWETTDPATGLAMDRWPTPSFASIAAVGFALTAYPIGVKHGWVTREAARARTLTTLQFFAGAPQGPEPTGASGYKGFFYHFLGVTKGQRFARCELSTIDTALLLGGVLFAQSFYDGDHPDEVRIRALAEQLYRAVDWSWIVPRPPFVSMGWHPETGFIPSDWNIYNEGMILYVLGLASPTHPLPPETWPRLTERFDASWTGTGDQAHLHFAPMFGHQYSHVWIDFRGIRDPYIATRGIDYFENSCRATYHQRNYAVANPGRWAGYGADCWGLTACDGPGDFRTGQGDDAREYFSYSARGPGERDDGTIAPTAALGSIAFAPEIVEPTIRAMHARYGAGIYSRYGFLDSFNPTLTAPHEPLKHGRIVPGIGWVDGDYLGIDQGPIVAMIENHRTGFVWEVMRRNPHIRRGLTLAGFKGGWLG